MMGMYHGRTGKHIVRLGVLAVAIHAGVVFGQGKATSVPAEVDKSNILSAVPAEAWAAVVINDLSGTSKVIDEYATRLGTKPPALQREILKMLGVAGKVESSRPMVVAIMDKTRYGEKPIAVIVSIKDFDSLKASFKAKSTETPGLFKGEKDEVGDVYFAKKGPFVVMGPTLSIVTAVSSSAQAFSGGMDSSARNLMKSSDVYVRVNFPSLNQFIKPFLTMFGAMAQMGAMGGMGGMGGEEGAESQPNAKTMAQMQMMGAMINVLVGLLDELNGFDLALNFKADLVRASAVLSFKSGQEMAGLLAAQKQTDQSLLKGLPGGPFTAAMGWQWQPKMTKFQETLIQITPPLATPEDTEKYKKLAKEAAELVTGTSLRLDIRAPKPEEAMLAFDAVLHTTNSQRYVEVGRQSIELQSKMKIPVQGGQEVRMEYKYEPGVRKIGNVSVDQFTIDLGQMMSLPGISGQQGAQAKGVLSMLFGNTSGMMQFRVAPVNEKVVIVSFGSDAAGLEKLVKLAQAGTSPLGDEMRVVQTAKLLPKQRLMEGYFNLGSLIGTITSATAALEGGREAGQIPTSLPAGPASLIGFTGSVEGSAVRMDMAVPFEVVSYLYSLKSMVPSEPPKLEEENDDVVEMEE